MKVTQGRLSCPKCGCGHLPVWQTRHRQGRIERIRYCRNCGKRMITREDRIG